MIVLCADYGLHKICFITFCLTWSNTEGCTKGRSMIALAVETPVQEVTHSRLWLTHHYEFRKIKRTQLKFSRVASVALWSPLDRSWGLVRWWHVRGLLSMRCNLDISKSSHLPMGHAVYSAQLCTLGMSWHPSRQMICLRSQNLGNGCDILNQAQLCVCHIDTSASSWGFKNLTELVVCCLFRAKFLKASMSFLRVTYLLCWRSRVVRYPKK